MLVRLRDRLERIVVEDDGAPVRKTAEGVTSIDLRAALMDSSYAPVSNSITTTFFLFSNMVETLLTEGKKIDDAALSIEDLT